MLVEENEPEHSGHFLVDDRPHKDGADNFEGEVIELGAEGTRDWPAVTEYLRART